MKPLKIIIAFVLCVGSLVMFAENLDFITTTEDTENDIFTLINNDPPVLNSNQSVNASSEFKNYESGKIIALNQITATSEELTFKVGEEKYFGNIKIKLHKCVKNLDLYNEDNYLLMTVTKYKIDEDPLLLFQGWMLSSSISLSTFEHPIYEIFAQNCFYMQYLISSLMFLIPSFGMVAGWSVATTVTIFVQVSFLRKQESSDQQIQAKRFKLFYFILDSRFRGNDIGLTYYKTELLFASWFLISCLFSIKPINSLISFIQVFIILFLGFIVSKFPPFPNRLQLKKALY